MIDPILAVLADEERDMAGNPNESQRGWVDVCLGEDERVLKLIGRILDDERAQVRGDPGYEEGDPSYLNGFIVEGLAETTALRFVNSSSTISLYFDAPSLPRTFRLYRCLGRSSGQQLSRMRNELRKRVRSRGLDTLEDFVDRLVATGPDGQIDE